MGNSDADRPAKASKSEAQEQEQPSLTSISPATPVYPDWPTFQAYSPIPPTGFFHSAMVSSPLPHPYVWDPQHLLPPYGTPPPFFMYPHGGIYAHPLMAYGAVPGSREREGKSSEGKEKRSMKRSEGRLGSSNMIIGKNSGFGKTSGASSNEAYSQSGDRGSEASSEGSDANSQNGSPPKAGDHQNSSDARTPQEGNPASTSEPVFDNATLIKSDPGPAVAGGLIIPTTKLNIETNFRNARNPLCVLKIRGKLPSTAVPTALTPGAPSEPWMQDVKDLKRQRRMQSNRESARRSRLRKQVKCEQLAHRIEILTEENASLRGEVIKLKEECEQLLTQNTSLQERLGEIPKGTEEPIHNKNEQSSAEDDHQ